MITLDRVTIQAGEFLLEDASLRVPTGAYGMLMGKTGSGKTSILEAVAGLRQVSGGEIYLGEVRVTRLKPAERNLGYVPQDGALFTTMTVRDHLEFALTIRRVSKKVICERVETLSRLLEIEPLLDRSVLRLSGGERQRVAIGRALAFRPRTLLLDEPLSALDDDTRQQMYRMLRHIQHETGVTTLHVTHHQQDVDQLGDIVFRIEDGRLSERGVAQSTPPISPTCHKDETEHESCNDQDSAG